MDQDAELETELDALLPRRRAFEAMQQARANATQGRGAPVEPTAHNRIIARDIVDEYDIGWLDKVGNDWRITTAVEPIRGGDRIRVEFPTASTVEKAIEEAVLTTAGYFWLLALGNHLDEPVFYEDVQRTSAPADDDNEIPF